LRSRLIPAEVIINDCLGVLARIYNLKDVVVSRLHEALQDIDVFLIGRDLDAMEGAKRHAILGN
jgi:hypothetical protein